MASAPLRFGLVGTGYWARIAHAPALASAEGIELAAVWGRDRQAAAALAKAHGATPYEDIDALLAAVDGVAFAVPPDVQAPIAVTAARAGKHLLLEKPLAISEAEADELVEAVDPEPGRVGRLLHPQVPGGDAGVAGRRHGARRLAGRYRLVVRVVPARVQPVQHPVAARQGRAVGHRPARDLAAVGRPRAGDGGDRRRGPGRRQPPDPAPPGRREQHGDRVAERGRGGRGASRRSCGEAPAGRPRLRERPIRCRRCGRRWANSLANVRSGRTEHPCDARFGRDVGRVIAEAQRQIDRRPVR